MSATGRLGARPLADGHCEFRVWAPDARRVELDLPEAGRRESMTAGEFGEFAVRVSDVAAGARYRFVLDGGDALPDPASRSQPDGVHGASQVVDTSFGWTDDGWVGIGLEDCVLYELHVGTFSAEGTFDGVIRRLEGLAGLGVTMLELLPVAQFPGERNWGYDGVFPHAVQSSYGGWSGLQRLVDACHARGVGVVLDVVYNHLGPEGNVLGRYGPYFTDAYATPWGRALNFDGPHSDGVRRYFIEQAVACIEELHLDGLRLDAVHAIHDRSARPFLEELTAAVHAAGERLGRRCLVIAESDLNAPRFVTDVARGGLGMDAMWCDDLHHALHVALTGERSGYYEDYGDLAQFAAAWSTGMAFTGQWSPHRKRGHGRPPGTMEPRRAIVCVQNHDQIGNRLRGDRLTASCGRDQLRFAMAALLLSPCTPMLFMGEEHLEERPFQYFVSHGDPDLVEAVRTGRREEFAAFGWAEEPPDPQAEQTFRDCVLSTPGPEGMRHREFVASLLRLRRELLRHGEPARAAVLDPHTVVAQLGAGARAHVLAFSFAAEARTLGLPGVGVGWRRVWSSAIEQVELRVEDPGSIVLQGWEVAVFGAVPPADRSR